MRLWGTAAAAAMAVSLGGCGGGGSTPAPTPSPSPTPTNHAPAFTSAAAVSVAENSPLDYRAAATDPNGDKLTCAIAGGADAGLFSIDAAGALAFKRLPDFETPADADADNIYHVSLSASDGRLTATLDFAVAITDVADAIHVRRVAAGFDHPVVVAAIPGDATHVIVGERGGGVYELDTSTGARTYFGTIDSLFGGDGTLLDLVVTDVQPPLGEIVMFASFTDPGGTLYAERVSSQNLRYPGPHVIVSLGNLSNGPMARNYGGGLAVGAGGDIYIGVGDGGDPSAAQDLHSPRGKILHFIRNPDPCAGASPVYFIPAPDNPFAATGDKRIFAAGFHEPTRPIITDAGLVAGDRGAGIAEELDLVTAGGNYGWPFREGSVAAQGIAPAGLIDPVAEYADDGTTGQAITAGLIYRGGAAALRDQYLFGDATGTLWTIPAALLKPGTRTGSAAIAFRTHDIITDAGHVDRVATFGEDAAHHAFIVDDDGDIFEITG